MNLSKISTLALAASLGFASVASAQPHQGPDRKPSQQHQQPVKKSQMARGAGPEHQFRKGQRLPSEWRNRQHVVTDWRAHHLSQPPRGQQWVQVGADFVLVAVATGVITSLVLAN